MKQFILLLLIVITFASVAVAQSAKDKIEIGVQTTSLTIVHPQLPFDDTQGGIGGRFTFNFNRSIAAEAEVNFFPQKQFILIADGSAIQAQFGVKAGKRFEKFGIFGKLRPGFLSVNRASNQLSPGAQVGLSSPTFERQTFFTIDAGGVLELYPSRRMVVRFEAGDTIIRHPEQNNLFFPFSGPIPQPIRPAEFKHNFQFTAGVGFRLGDFPEEDTNLTTSGSGSERTKRFEVGVQFTSLFVNPTNVSGSLISPRIHAEPGFGPRFTFNLTDNIAFEVEGNYYTRLQRTFFLNSGHIFQAQFGGKVGKRFDRWGVFGKARPGFVGFTRVTQLPAGAQVPAIIPTERKFYPSLDVGGVVEFYISPRWMARFDVGDTMIRYDEISIPSLGALQVFVLQPKQTRHNLQVTSGIGFRF